MCSWLDRQTHSSNNSTPWKGEQQILVTAAISIIILSLVNLLSCHFHCLFFLSYKYARSTILSACYVYSGKVLSPGNIPLPFFSIPHFSYFQWIPSFFTALWQMSLVSRTWATASAGWNIRLLPPQEPNPRPSIYQATPWIGIWHIYLKLSYLNPVILSDL